MLNSSLPQFSEQDNPASFSSFRKTRFLTYSYLIVFNLWLLLNPSRLSYDWQLGSIPLLKDWSDPRVAAIVVSAIVILILLHQCFFTTQEHHQSSLFLGLSMTIIPFLPASNAFIPVGFVVAERVLYIPSIGFCILVVHGFSRLLESFKEDPKTSTRLRIFFFLLLFVFVRKTVDRNTAWNDRESLFRSGLETLPQNAKMHYNFGNLQKDSGNPTLAEKHYRIALRLWPDHASAHNNLGTLLLTNRSEAESHFLEAIRINPRHARAHFNLANLISGESERSVDAIKLMETALSLDPSHRDTYTLLGSMYADVGRLNEADQIHQALLHRDDADADAYNNYGAFLHKQGQNAEALHYYQRSISLKPNHTVALVNAARLLRTLQHNGQAEELYKRALSIDDDPDILSNLGVMYLNTGRTSDARETFEKLLERDPNHTEGKVQYAQVLIRERNLSIAQEQLVSVLRNHSSHRDALHQLAILYSHLNRTTEALDYILRALRSCTIDDVACGQIHADYGNILKDTNDMDTAAQSYKMAVRVNPTLSHAHLNLGVIYHIKHNYRLAWQHYRAAQILEPHNQVLLDNMEKLRRTEIRMNAPPSLDSARDPSPMSAARERSCS